MPPPKRPPEKPKNVFKTLGRIFSYLSGNKLLLVIFFLGIVVSALAQVAGAAMLKPVIDEGIAPLKDDPENAELMQKFVWMLVRMALVYGAGVLSS